MYKNYFDKSVLIQKRNPYKKFHIRIPERFRVHVFDLTERGTSVLIVG